MFLLRLTVVWTLLHVYVTWRATSVPCVVRRAWLRRGLLILAALLWPSFPLARLLQRHTLQLVVAPLELIGATWLGIVFFAFLLLLTVELVTGFGLLLRRAAPTLRGWALALAGVISLAATIQALRPPVVRDYEVVIPDLPADADGLTIVQLADVHAGALAGGRWLAGLAARVNALHPDLIVIAGDLLDGQGEVERDPRLGPALRTLSAPLGTWAVLGNHERHLTELSAEFIESSGVHLLRDEWREVRPGLILAGAEDPGHRTWSSQKVAERIQRTLTGLPGHEATVLLLHRPQAAEVAARAGVDLMLSGHTHGGQLWPFTMIAGAVHPLLGGRYDVAGMPVIVSRGVGTWGPRMRLFRPGELLRIRLRSPAAAR